MQQYKLLWLVDGTYTSTDDVPIVDTKDNWLEFFGCFMAPYYNFNEFELIEVLDGEIKRKGSESSYRKIPANLVSFCKRG